MQDDELRAIVGDDLHALVRARALPVVSVSRVSPLYSPSWTRAAFRLALADGSLAKGLRLESTASAERAVRLGRHLPSGPFPQIVAQQGAALIAEWIAGAVLSSCRITHDRLRRLGAILRSTHEITLPEDLLESSRRYPRGTSRERLAAKVERLCRAGELPLAEGARALDVADTHAPANLRVTLVHGDFCPENIVMDASGSFHVVDNDTIDLHAAEFDLARTWYRWPMTVAERVAFEEGYGARDVVVSYHEHFLHWAVVVLVAASEFRLRQQLPGASEPLRQLRDILERRSGHGVGSPANH